ncbi:hypothetical protein BHE74_00004027 [Ensete ventricosum]|nr:hypothetical protein BHE74_00004027 [Ensete ventricosum]
MVSGSCAQYDKVIHKYYMFNAEDVSEDLKIALRKRAEIDTKYLITFLQNDASELRQSLTRYVAVYAEFRRDWAEALRFYEEAYRALREVLNPL